MDQKSKSESKYAARSMMRVISDMMDITGAKFFGSSFADIEVACVKATLEDAVVPKEKHVQTLKRASAAGAPRQEVTCVIENLLKRLETHKSDWLVTLKTLIVFDRLMREVDSTFQEELLKYSERTPLRRVLRHDSFADHATRETWDMSAWIRVYSVYLDERLESFRAFRFDTEDMSSSRLKDCSTPTLLYRLPQVQKLLTRLLACVPQGPAQHNPVVIQACEMVMKEMRPIYKAVCEGVMNLADKFFDMERADALRGLEAYKENVVLNERINAYISAINVIGALRGAVQFPELQSLPPDFLTTLQEYSKEAPTGVDPNAPPPHAGHAGSGGSARSTVPPALTTTASIAREGGTTSAAVSGLPPTTQAPIQGVHKIGPPATAAAAAPVDVVDLLGGDFGAMSMASPQHGEQYRQPPMQQYGQPPKPGQDQYGQQQQSQLAPSARGFADNAFDPFGSSAAASAARASASHAPVAASSNFDPFSGSSFHAAPPAASSPQQSAQHSAQAHAPHVAMQQSASFQTHAPQQPAAQHQYAPQPQQTYQPLQYSPPSQPQAAFAHAPPVASNNNNLFGAPAFPPPPPPQSHSHLQPQQPPTTAYNHLQRPAQSNNPYPPAAAQSNNHFGGAPVAPAAAPAPACGAAPSARGGPAGGWASAQPGTNKFQTDPLHNLSFDLLGAKQALAPQSLKDMRGAQGSTASPNLV